MRQFTCVKDIGDLKYALKEAFEIKKDRFKYGRLGRNKTLLIVLFNSSLRTRLATQKAALNLGMNVMVLDMTQDGWKLETGREVIMEGDKPRHLLEAIPSMGCYCDLIGIRSSAGFHNPKDDYAETILNQFIRYSGCPVISLESATRHPLQSFADLITIEEYKKTAHPKVILTWTPYSHSLSQAVPNSFAEWMNTAGYDLVITHPEGYELAREFTGNARIAYDQTEALKGADFVYAMNWAAYASKHSGQVLKRNSEWVIGESQRTVTNDAYFMRYRPIQGNTIITQQAIENPRSLIIPQAVNLEISAQVVLKMILTGI